MSSPSQLYSCVDATAILKSPVNTSTAKNHWSFGKDNRFKTPKFYCEQFYNLPDTKSDRKAGNYLLIKAWESARKLTYNSIKINCM